MNKETVELDLSHWHEVLDRAAVASAHLKMAFSSHPAVTQTPEIGTLLESAVSAIDDLYEGIHKYRFGTVKQESNINKTIEDDPQGNG